MALQQLYIIPFKRYRESIARLILPAGPAVGHSTSWKSMWILLEEVNI